VDILFLALGPYTTEGIKKKKKIIIIIIIVICTYTESHNFNNIRLTQSWVKYIFLDIICTVLSNMLKPTAPVVLQ